MKKKLLIAICVIVSVIFLIGFVLAMLGLRYIHNEIKTDENDYLEVSQTVAYGLEDFIKSGDTEDLACIAVDIYQMSKMTDVAANIVSSENAEIIKELAGISEYDRSILSQEAQRLKTAFEMIAENGADVDYAYAQIKISITNCGY